MLQRIRALSIGLALAIIGTVSVGVAAWMIFDANSREITYKQTAKNSANADAYRAREYEARNCGPLTPQARDKCISEQDYAAHQAQHDDRDLEAQRTTAVWTHYLGIAGIFGTAFGTLGVALVLLTFMEQRRTSRAELRAYIFPETVTLYDGSSESLREDYKLVPVAEIILKNFGSTPARNVKHIGALVVAPNDLSIDPVPPLADEMKKLGGGTLAPSGQQTAHFLLRDNPHGQIDGRFCMSWQTIHDMLLSNIVLVAYGRIEYTDVFGEPRVTEYRFFHTNHWPPTGGSCGMRVADRGNRDK